MTCFKRKIRDESDISVDFRCVLNCRKRKNEWTFLLTNIEGSEIETILGFKTQNLENILESEIRERHYLYMKEILESRNKYCLDEKMKRNIMIRNPLTGEKIKAKMKIIYLKTLFRNIIFKLYFSEITKINRIIDETDILSHDLITVFKKVVSLSKNLLECSSDEERHSICDTLNDLGKEGLRLCSKTKTENAEIQENKNFFRIYMIISNLIKDLKFKNIKCSFLSNLSLNLEEMECFEQLFFYFIEHCSQFEPSEISVSVNQEFGNLKINIVHNGIQSFDNLEKENNLCLKWRLLGGHILIDSNSFISIRGHLENNVLHIDKILELSNLKHSKTILIVDDIYLNLKMSLIGILKSLSLPINYKNLPKNLYDIYFTIISDIADVNFIFVQNSEIIKDIYILTNPEIVMTDLEMPVFSGYDFVNYIFEQNQNQKIIINSSTRRDDFLLRVDNCKFENILFLEKGITIDFCQIFEIRA